MATMAEIDELWKISEVNVDCGRVTPESMRAFKEFLEEKFAEHDPTQPVGWFDTAEGSRRRSLEYCDEGSAAMALFYAAFTGVPNDELTAFFALLFL